MATITYNPGNGAYASPLLTFDITSVVVDAYPGGRSYISFDTDGTMFAIQVTAQTQPDGTSKQIISGWSHIAGSTFLQTATCALDLQPFLDIMNSRNPSSTQAMNYLLSGSDDLLGSHARDNMTSGGGADTLAGGGGNDVIKAGSGADVITGGMGADHLTGGGGADQFIFTKPGEGGDVIRDFTPGTDHIALNAHAFALTAPLTDGHGFTQGTTATGPGATLLYDAATGWLGYDADGAGGAAAITLATLSGHAALTAADILLL